MKTLAIVLALAATAEAKPKATAVSPDVHKKYGELMALGHKAQKKKDWTGAIAAFEKAVEAIPDDPTALTELGWTAYLAKDLDKAEAATKRAVASDGAPNIRGAALYNLGLVDEARHDTKGAIAAYIASIKVRPHSVVRAALAKLDKAAAAALDPFAAEPLTAIASPDAFCKARPPVTDDARNICACTTKELAKAAGPFQAVMSVTEACHDEGSAASEEDWLAVKRDGKWFVTDSASSTSENHRCEASVAITAEAKGKRVIASIVVDGHCGNGIDDHTWYVTSLLALGTKGGAVAATPAFEIKRDEFGTGNDTGVSIDVELAPTWNADGSLTLAGSTKGLDKAEAANTVGRHDLGLD
jgi:tetratricopeptide (TPR) repeat protein